MKYRFLKFFFASLMLGFAVTSCSDSDEPEAPKGGMITINQADQNINVDCDAEWQSFTFVTRAAWTAELEEKADWLTLAQTSGAGGASQKIGFDLNRNTKKESRTATIVIKCAGETAKVVVTQAGTTRDEIDPADIPNYEMFYYPGPQSEYFTSKEALLLSDSKYNWNHMKQSKHFFCFWDTRFGPDPNGADVPDWAKVDVDDLLEKAEHFYQTNVETLKMTTTGKGISMLDSYKMQIWLIYDEGWTATGSGWGEIGALWVTPSTCKPVGSVIAHEIGHSFQFQAGADRAYASGEDVSGFGFRYGFGGSGGCAYWEQCAQWQSMYDYPYEQFGQDFNPWLVHYHRHFNHEWMRYQSYWLQSYWVMLHGIDVFGSIWHESNYPEDPIDTYVRLYLGGDYGKFWEEYYDYAARMVNWDIDNVREYKDNYWGKSSNYKTSLFQIGEYEYQVSYSSVPETAGFNIIRLNVPAGGGNVSVDFKALPVGSALADGDTGAYLKGDNEAVGGNTSHYNLNTINKSDPDFRYGFVAIAGGQSTYSDHTHNAEGTATFTVPANTDELYLVVVPTPAQYNQHAWDVDDLTDVQWPYSFKIKGTDLFGNMDIDPDNDPQDLQLSYDLACDAALGDYVIGTIDLSSNGDLAKLAQAFVMQPAELSAVTQAPLNGTTGTPAEGNVVFGLVQANGNIGYDYTANAGFYITAEGNIGSWGNNDPIWVEYDKENFVLTYGHKPGCSVAGTTYTVKPCLVYTKGGKQYVATFQLNLNF